MASETAEIAARYRAALVGELEDKEREFVAFAVEHKALTLFDAIAASEIRRSRGLAEIDRSTDMLRSILNDS